jgi:glycosyltransferase involved in cell wall biosynthesis
MSLTNTDTIKVLFLPLTSLQYASSRYRVYNYADRLPSYGIKVRILHPSAYTFIAKAIYIFQLLFNLFWADVVFIQKKLFRTPLYLLIRLLNNRIVFDFDDAIYSEGDQVRKMLNRVLKSSRHVIVGNRQLENYVREFMTRITCIATPIDLQVFTRVPKEHSDRNVVTIGWMGLGGNQYHVALLEPVFERIYRYKGNGVQLMVISNHNFRFQNCQLPVVNIEWSLSSELESLRSIDIGIMPLTNDEFSRGKCSLKALQYMSLCVATVASPVGMNCDVIHHGENGLLAETEEEWFNALWSLIENSALRKKLGIEARRTVEQEYCYEVTTPQLAKALRQAASLE